MDISSQERENQSQPQPQPQPQLQWALLPTELLAIISQKLADIADFARFRSVCTSWRSAAKPQDLAPQLPWLLLPYDPKSSSRSFCSISTESIYTLDLPETRDRIICGSSNGWLVTLDETLSVSLFNPLTRSLVRLPPITTLPESFERVVRDDCLSRVRCDPWSVVPLQEFYCLFDCHALIPPNLIDGGGVVVLMFADSEEARYWRPGDAAWTSVELGTHIEAITFYDGRLFVVYCDGRTATCELGPQAKATVVPSLELDDSNRDRYLITSPVEGELLLVTFDFYRDDETCFVYRKLEEKEGVMTWSEIRGVGDCSVFLTRGLPNVMGRQMPVACSASGYRRNCVCYVDLKITLGGQIRQLSRVKVKVIVIDNFRAETCHGPWETPHPDSQVIVIDDFRAETCHGPWETPHPDSGSPCWIIPSLY